MRRSLNLGVGAATLVYFVLAAAPPSLAESRILLAQTVRESPLDDRPAVDAGRTQQPRSGTSPAPVAPAPRPARGAPPADEDGPFVRETPPPPRANMRAPAPPTRLDEKVPRRAEPAPPYDAPRLRDGPRTGEPVTRRADPPARRVAPPARSSFYANCTQQCHLSCEASFEACNADASPARPECVRKLESCRVERCACRIQ